MSQHTHCPTCGAALPGDAPGGLCVRCLLRRVVEAGARGSVGLPAAGAGARRFGDYELIEEIAHGGMGVVFKARQASLNRIVALKMIRAGQLASPIEVQRFHAEAEAAARLEHPHIVAIYDVGEEEGQHYFTMKFVEGGSLSAALARSEPNPDRAGQGTPVGVALPPPAAARLVATVARAVHFAHQRGILHRDLKPGNILLDARGEPLVTDFGLARLVSAESGITLSGAVLGTPDYMAPEQARGDSRALTTAADVYSLGAILYELLAGEPPFRAATPLETLRRVAEEDPVAPSVVRRNRLLRAVKVKRALPSADIGLRLRDLDIICLKCLEKDPQRRYSSAEAAAEDLERWLRHEPILARPASAWERSLKWCQRKPAIAALLMVSVVAVVAFLTLVLFNRAQLAHERDQLRHNLYSTDLSLAHRALEDRNLALAHRTLAFHIPSTSGGSSAVGDLRGFEWRHLWQRCQGDQLAVLEHTNPVTCAVFAPDGRALATAGDNGRVQLWDAQTRRQLVAWAAHADYARCAFSPDGGTLVTAGYDGQVRLWALAGTNVPVARASFPVNERVFSLTCLSSRPWVAVGFGTQPGCAPPGHVRWFDLAQQKELGTWRDAGGWICASPDGQRIATGPCHAIRIWAADSGAKLQELAFATPQSEVTQAMFPGAFSPDGQRLVCTSWLGTKVTLWDLGRGGPLPGLAGHRARVLHAVFSPDGQRVASASADQTVLLWDLATPDEPRVLQGHLGEVVWVDFSPDGTMVASASSDGTARLWPTAAGEKRDRLDSVKECPMPPLVFTPDGKSLVAADQSRQVRLWEFETLASRPLGSARGVWPQAVLDAGRTLLTLGPDEAGGLVLHSWDLADGRRRVATPLAESAARIACAAVAPTARLFAAGASSNVLVWGVTSGRLLKRLAGHLDQVTSLEFSPDGGWLASAAGDYSAQASQDRTVRLWRVGAGEERAVLPVVARHLAFSPDGRTLATAGANRLIQLWDVRTGQLRATLAGHLEKVLQVVFSPDGRTLASTSADHTLKLWSLSTHRELATLAREEEWPLLAFAPDGQTLVAGHPAGRLRVWRAPGALAHVVRAASPCLKPATGNPVSHRVARRRANPRCRRLAFA
jgi:WD40 repeat protein/serine/threonine protein kinase